MFFKTSAQSILIEPESKCFFLIQASLVEYVYRHVSRNKTGKNYKFEPEQNQNIWVKSFIINETVQLYDQKYSIIFYTVLLWSLFTHCKILNIIIDLCKFWSWSFRISSKSWKSVFFEKCSLFPPEVFKKTFHKLYQHIYKILYTNLHISNKIYYIYNL